MTTQHPQLLPKRDRKRFERVYGSEAMQLMRHVYGPAFGLTSYLEHNEQRTNRSDGDLRKSPDGR